MRVLLGTEDGYPFHADDTAAWCDALTTELPDTEFTVLSVTTHPFVRWRFEVPRNVVTVINVPISGMLDPAEYGNHTWFPDYVKSRWFLSGDAVQQDFVPHYEQFLRGVADPASQAWALAGALLQMHLHLRFYDYDATLRHPAIWKTFARVMRDQWQRTHPAEKAPDLVDLHNGWQCLYRLLLPLTVDLAGFDVVHASSASYCGLACVMAKLRHHTPYLLTEHGIYLREQHLTLGRAPLPPFLRWFLSRVAVSVSRVNYAFADQVSPVCHHHVRWEQWLGVDPERIRVIYNGADDPAIEGTVNQPIPATVVTVGPITATSGHGDLIEAAALVRRSISDVRFRICGEGDDESMQHCRDLVHGLGLEDTVTFEDVTHAARMLHDAQVFAVPTASDTFPRSLIDAMLSEVPVVATTVGGIPEAVGDTAMLVPPGDPAAMAESIAALLTSPDSRRSLAQHGRTRAVELFGKSRFVEAYRASYERLTRRVLADQPAAIVERTNVSTDAPTVSTAA
jgi:glycosyltransferase involved in cell wall biosynthesis